MLLCYIVFEEFASQCSHKSAGCPMLKIDCSSKPFYRSAYLVLQNQEMMVDKIQTKYDRQKDKLDLPNWLNKF